MTVKAGEECKNSGDFRCRRCGELIHVEEGLTVPDCPGCGNTKFSWRNRPPSKSLSRQELRKGP